MKAFKTLSFMALTVALVLAVVSCGPQAGKGSLIVNVQAAEARSVVPTIDGTPGGAVIPLAITAYSITIWAGIDDTGTVVVGPDAALVDGQEFKGLLPGDYFLTVKGLAGVRVMGTGGAGVAVSPGSPSHVDLIVAENPGAGDLVVTASWTTGVVFDPNITTTLTRGGTTIVDQGWTLGAGTPPTSATYTDSLVAGWYGLSFAPYDHAALEPSAGFATLVRMAEGMTSAGAFSLTPSATTGGMMLDLDSQFYVEMVLASTGAGTSVTLDGLNPTATATITNADVAVWYVDGVYNGIANTFVFDSAILSVGTHRVDVLGYTGMAAGQKTYTVTVEPINQGKNINGVYHDHSGLAVIITAVGLVVDNVVLVLPAGGPDYAFALNQIPDGDYKLKVTCGALTKYWNSTGSGTDSMSSGDTLVIPNPAGTAYTCSNW